MFSATRKRYLLAFSIFCSVLAHAEDNPVLEEILVTSQRRVSAESSTPLSLSVLNAETIERDAIQSIAGLQGRVSGLQLIPHQNAGSTLRTFIRGIGNNDEQVIQDPSVAIYVDDIYLGRNQGLTADTANLERIEVLRGPQGTLYGRNASGGAIRLITGKPDAEAFGFEQRLRLGSRDLIRSQTMLNLPLGNSAAIRFNYSSREQDGFVENSGTGESSFGALDQSGWRADLLWQTTESLSIRLTADSAELADSPQWVGQVSLAQSTASRPSRSSPQVVDLRNNSVMPSGQSLTVEWQLSDSITLKSISAHRELEDTQNQLYHPGRVMGQPLILSDAEGNQKQWSHEIQLSGLSETAGIDYVAGVFWFEEDINRNASNQLTARRQKTYVMGTGLHNQSLAGYAHAGWTPASLGGRVRVSGGFRWSADSREATVARAVENLTTGVIQPMPVPGIGDRDFENVSPTIGIEWYPVEQMLLFLDVTDGYKSGGFNARASSTARFNEGFDDETLRSWEAGIKWRNRPDRLQLNVVAFHTDYDDIQVTVQSDPDNPVIFDMLNAGEATIDGIEASMSTLLTDNLSLWVEYAWLETGFNQVQSASGVNAADDYRFLYAPKHHFVSRLRYQLPATPVGRLNAELQYSWQDAMYSSDTATAGDYRITGYGLLNARVAMTEIDVAGGAVELVAWANNLLDEEYYSAHFNAGLPSAIWGDPRTVGVELVFRF